jgi:hypothetical protein
LILTFWIAEIHRPQRLALESTLLLQVPQTPLRGAWIGLCAQFQNLELVIEQAS